MKLETWQVLLALQKTLLGTVTFQLRSVNTVISEANKKIYIRFVYDGKVPEATLALWKEAGTNVTHYLPTEALPYTVAVELIHLDYPARIDIPEGGRVAYFRSEKHLVSNFKNC